MTIIATTDFSEIAENAVEYAAAYADVCNAQLIMFNAFSYPVHASNAHLSAQNFEELFNKNLERLKNKANELSEKYKVEVISESSLAYIEDELIALTEKYNPAMIVMGMVDKSLEQDLIGNTTTSAIKILDVPILAVPLEAKFNTLKKILFACDKPQEIPQHVIEKVKDIAHYLNSEIEIFSVDEKVNQLSEKNSDSLAENTIDEHLEGINYYYKNVESNAVIEEIRKEIKNFNANLLIMAPREYGFWESIVHRSKTRIMASGLSIPLLSIPIKN
ncbi:hypothetical protein GCM10007424_20960 [Flavobacterium suaedae]|uniref:UspA domain-containing protein n=1 Tax=Flavobacterium suaedae TaxID=1767027 RepID=A0ABQ1JX07_9FLAO|nr:universal stress protein [Flavobacterium suaedae]GGB80673.1 hypothetical protein GCM10007424_20960 [Flavobacterium suaedae]